MRNGKAANLKASGPALNYSLLADPNPVQVVLRFGDPIDCLSFGGTQQRFVPGTLFQSLHAPAPPKCP